MYCSRVIFRSVLRVSSNCTARCEVSLLQWSSSTIKYMTICCNSPYPVTGSWTHKQLPSFRCSCSCQRWGSSQTLSSVLGTPRGMRRQQPGHQFAEQSNVTDHHHIHTTCNWASNNFKHEPHIGHVRLLKKEHYPRSLWCRRWLATHSCNKEQVFW